MKPSPLRQLQILAALFVVAAVWISGVHGVAHHHHDDFKTHGDCAFCHVIGSSGSLPDASAPAAVVCCTATLAAGSVTEAITLSTRFLKLRAPSTSPPVFPA